MFYFGCLLMGLAVALQAFGYHALQSILDAKRLGMFETASRYFMWGSLWVMVMGVALKFLRISSLGLTLILTGLMIFCGSLFAYIALPKAIFMMATPVGGLMMIAGFWICAIYGWIGEDEKDKPTSPPKVTRKSTIY